jgi:hypothetical protein
MKKFTVMFAAFMAIFLFASCQKTGPVKIAEWVKYDDPYFRVHFSYPKGWHITSSGDRVNVYPKQEVVDFFYDPNPRDASGVEVSIVYSKPEVLPVVKALADSDASEMKSVGYDVSGVIDTRVESEAAVQFSFKGTFSENAKIAGTKTYAVKDSFLYIISFKGFNKDYELHKEVFDTVFASIELPKPKTKAVVTDPEVPTEEFTTFENDYVKVAMPSNFEPSFPPIKGDIKFSILLKGYRMDCTIQIDQFPAKGLKVEKVFEQNSKFFKATGKGERVIDEQKAMYVDYAPTKTVASRAYFIVKNDKVYRILINYFVPKKDKFVPAFDKVLASLKLKG